MPVVEIKQAIRGKPGGLRTVPPEAGLVAQAGISHVEGSQECECEGAQRARCRFLPPINPDPVNPMTRFPIKEAEASKQGDATLDVREQELVSS